MSDTLLLNPPAREEGFYWVRLLPEYGNPDTWLPALYTSYVSVEVDEQYIERHGEIPDGALAVDFGWQLNLETDEARIYPESAILALGSQLRQPAPEMAAEQKAILAKARAAAALILLIFCIVTWHLCSRVDSYSLSPQQEVGAVARIR
jgi:hypothetical protein